MAYCIAASLVATYLATLTGFCIVESWIRWVLLVFACFVVCMLFIVGHDACHMSFLSNPDANRLIGYVAFVPTLHPVAAWEIGHNRRHHAFTNLRSIDYVWRPWSIEEFQRASNLDRYLYRFYHSLLGIGLYYPIEIWLKHLWFGDDLDRSQRDFKRVYVDRFRAAFGFLSVLFVCAAISVIKGRPPSAVAVNVAFAAGAPFALYSYLMSVVIFIHHRDPRVIWFDDLADYDPTSAQIEGTVHAECPRPIEMAFLDIFQHTAHHAEDRIPLYRLRGAQRSLEARVGDRVLRVPLTLGSFLQTLSACQLYDYNRRQWLRCSDAKT